MSSTACALALDDAQKTAVISQSGMGKAQLIDEIVYRLCGLTEAEIKIVSIRGCNSSMVRVA